MSGGPRGVIPAAVAIGVGIFTGTQNRQRQAVTHHPAAIANALFQDITLFSQLYAT